MQCCSSLSPPAAESTHAARINCINVCGEKKECLNAGTGSRIDAGGSDRGSGCAGGVEDLIHERYRPNLEKGLNFQGMRIG